MNRQVPFFRIRQKGKKSEGHLTIPPAPIEFGSSKRTTFKLGLMHIGEKQTNMFDPYEL